jgi:hypothetical protein
MLPYTDEPPSDPGRWPAYLLSADAVSPHWVAPTAAALPFVITEPRECAWLRDALADPAATE